jgi:hypothetical protein
MLCCTVQICTEYYLDYLDGTAEKGEFERTVTLMFLSACPIQGVQLERGTLLKTQRPQRHPHKQTELNLWRVATRSSQ